MLDASVEVRTAITYATVINVVAIVPVFFLEGLSGSFFQPLVLSYGLAVLVSMLVALTVTPALCLICCCRDGQRRAARVAAAAGAKRGLRRACSTRVIRAAGPAIAHAAVCLAGRALHLPDARASAAAELQGTRLPDALADPAGDLGAGGDADLGRAPARTCGRSPACATAARTSARRCWRDEVYGVDFGENWISVDKNVDYDKTLASVHRRRSRATRASTATCRPTCASASRRC